MIKLKDLKEKFVFTTKIELDEDNFIELREPTQKELIGLTDEAEKNLQLLEKIFPSCVVSSSIENDNGEPATGTEIYSALKDSGSTMTEILTTWLESIPFQSRLMKKQKSDK